MVNLGLKMYCEILEGENSAREDGCRYGRGPDLGLEAKTTL
jgi:hypothetical protein